MFFFCIDAKKGLCIPCQPQCRECNEALDCSACEFRFVLHAGKCLSSCQEGFYETDDYACAPCNEACSTCRGPHEDHCVTCAPSFSEHGGACVGQCPPGFWSDASLGRRQCLPCPPGCQDCVINEDGYGLVCTQCLDQWELDTSTSLCLNPSVNLCSEGNHKT